MTPALSSKHERKDHKAKPKQPLSTSDRLKRLFTSLCAQIDGGHFNNAVKECDRILRLDPSDKEARQTKLFLLLQTEQYREALNLIDAEESGHCAFERAYTLYRLQCEVEARDILEEVRKAEDDRGAVHLDAQLNYREGLYQEAFDLYNQLLDTAEPNSEEHSDILTNLQASQRHLDFIETGFRHALGVLPPSIISNLETTPPPIQQSSIVANVSSTTSDGHENAKPTPKKVRLRRVPAGVVPGVTPPPDPERWIKKSERSTFNQGRRRKGAGGGGATQGAAVDNAPTHPVPSSKSSGKGKKRK